MEQIYKENTDEFYMQRCLELAASGIANTAPNPMVGSIIVHNNRIIGEGYHQQFGQAHAEVNAINAVKKQDLLPESTIYVNLEPCAHYGKTPPCANLIASKKIKRVVIGTTDPFAKVAGKGVNILENAGCEVSTNVLPEQCRELNRRFFTFHEKKRPYIILKWAQTIDGLIDKIRTKETPREPFWITNLLARRLVHKWRSEEAAIMVGTQTAAKDNPALNVRSWVGRNPVRIVLDQHLRLPDDLAFFDQSTPTVVFTEKEQESKTNLQYIKVAHEDNVLDKALEYLYDNELNSLIVEGGAMLINSFIKRDLWDEARVLIGNKQFHNGTRAPKIDFDSIADEWIGDSRLFYYRNF